MKAVVKKFILKDDNKNVVLKRSIMVNTVTNEKTYKETNIIYNDKGQKIRVSELKNNLLVSVLEFKYNDDGKLSDKIITTSFLIGHKKYEYDENGDMIEINMKYGTTNRHIFDDQYKDKVIKIIYNNGNVHSFVRDADGNLLRHLRNKEVLYDFEYNENGKVVKRTDKKSILSFEYDSEGRTTRISDSVAGDVEYHYVAPGLCIITDHRKGDDITTYEFDLNRYPGMDLY